MINLTKVVVNFTQFLMRLTNFSFKTMWKHWFILFMSSNLHVHGMIKITSEIMTHQELGSKFFYIASCLESWKVTSMALKIFWHWTHTYHTPFSHVLVHTVTVNHTYSKFLLSCLFLFKMDSCLLCEMLKIRREETWDSH